MGSDRSLRWRYPGARWWKFDFHAHTPASSDYGKGSGQDSSKGVTPGEWLLGFMRADVDCVAVTDHNSGEWVDDLKDAHHELERERPPDFRPLSLFPGVEITANGGVHVLAVLDADKGAADVAALLGAVGYQGVRGSSDAAADSSTIEVVKAIRDAGGIPILAHVDKASGAWQLPGNTLAPLFDFDDLFAMEVVDPDKACTEAGRHFDTASQCGTFFALRLSNPSDRARVQGTLPDGLAGLLDVLPVLRTGEAIVTGEAAKLPMRCRVLLPAKEHRPRSEDPEVSIKWEMQRRNEGYERVVASWRAQSPLAVAKHPCMDRIPVEDNSADN